MNAEPEKWLGQLLGLIGHEWRRLRLSPVWLIGLGCALLLQHMESGPVDALGYPTQGQSLYAFQLASSVVLGVIAFLLCSGSVAADLEPSREALIRSRAVARGTYVFSKYLGVLSFTLALVLPLLLVGVLAPVTRGVLSMHNLRPFALVFILAILPMACYVCALAVFLTTVLRKVILTVPVFLMYFFAAALLPSSGMPEGFNWMDFTHRLYPRELTVDAPVRLHDVSFSGLLDPVAPGVLLRAAVYLLLSGILVWLTAGLGAEWVAERAQKLAGHLRLPQRVRQDRAAAEDAGVASSGRARPDEWVLFLYSAKILKGRNLLAMGLVAVGLLTMILTYPVGDFQTRADVLFMQMEMFGPLFGVIMFSDLVAADFEERRADILRVTRRGPVWIVVRKLIHGTIFATMACGIVLTILRVVYTSFNVLEAFGILLPGILYFGMVGLLAASLTHRALVGYTVGTVAMLMSSMLSALEPLTPLSYFLKKHLANGRLWDEANWILAKLVFMALAITLSIAVLRLLARPAAWRRVVAGPTVLVLGTYVGLRLLWSEPAERVAGGGGAAREWVLQENEGTKTVRKLLLSSHGPNSRQSASLIDVQLNRTNGTWVTRGETPVSLAREFELGHLDLQASVAPAEAGMDAEARFGLKSLNETERLMFYLAAELEVKGLWVDGKAAAFRKTADLVEATLPERAAAGRVCEVRVVYGGELQLPHDLGFEQASRDALFVTTRWFPALHGSDELRGLFTCRAVLDVPAPYSVAAARLVSESAGRRRFVWETPRPLDSLPLFVGRFTEYKSRHGETELSFCSFSVGKEYAARILARAVEVLSAFEQAFGPYPYPRLAIVENAFQGAGGAAFPSLVTLKPDRLVPEHERRLLDGYLPHEIAHSWWDSLLPKWVAEGSAVFANAFFLEASRSPVVARDFLDREISGAFFAPGNQPAPLVDAQGATLYAKGGYLLNMMASAYGKPALFAAMKSYLNENAAERVCDKAARTERFMTRLQAISADPGFVQDWVRGMKRFDPAIMEFEQRTNGATHQVVLKLQQLGDVQFPVTVRFKQEKGNKDVVWDGTKGSEVVLETADPVLSAELDPDHRLLDWNRANNVARPGFMNPGMAQEAQALARWTTFTTADGLPATDILGLCCGGDGRVYASSFSMGLAMNRKWGISQYDGAWKTYAPVVEPIYMVNAMAQQTDGTLWLASHGQLRRVRGNDSLKLLLGESARGNVIGHRKFARYPHVESSLPGSRVYALLSDREDRLWVGTDHGLATLSEGATNTRTWGAADGFTGCEVFSLAEDESGRILAGTDRGLFVLANGRWQREEGVPVDLVLAVSAGQDGTVWCGTYNSGLIAVRDNGCERYDEANGNMQRSIYNCVAAGPEGSVWAGSPDGLLHFDRRKSTTYTRSNSGLPSHRIRSIVVTRSGTVWIATDAGVTRFTPEQGQSRES